MPDVIIDQISEEKGNVILLLRQVESWSSREALAAFQDRLNGYIDIIINKLIYEEYPDLKGKPLRIRLLCHHDFPDEMKHKLDRVNYDLQKLGIGFEIVRIEIADPAKRKDPIKEGIASLFKWLGGK